MKQLKLLTAKWCGPCKVLKNRIEKENLCVDIVDIDEDFEFAKKYSVKSVPCLLSLDGEDFEKIQGQEEIVQTIKQNN